MIANKKPFISIITISYNCIDNLKKTVHSVNNQSYRNYEHLIIDGDSNDGTKQYLRDCDFDKISYLSEPDNGIYDAMNKGLDLCNGDFILMLNSGDFFYSDISLETFVKNINDFNQIYFTKTFVVDEFGYCYHKPKDNDLDLSKIKNFPIHQSIFVPKIYNSLRYDTSFVIAGDTDYLIKLFKFKRPIFIDIELVVFNLGGISSLQKNFNELKIYIQELNYVIRMHENPNLIKLLIANILVISKYFFIKLFSKKMYSKLLKYFNAKN